MRICCPFIAKRFWFGNVLTTPRLPKFSSRTSLRALVPPVCRVKRAKLVILYSEILDVVTPANRGRELPRAQAAAFDTPPVRSKPTHEHQHNENDQDYADDTDTAMTEAVAVAAEAATEATNQEDDEDDDEYESYGHDLYLLCST
jgi:hypothetical protein